jgi:hypothetical protein
LIGETVLAGLLTNPLRRRSQRRDIFRIWRSACAEANETYALWAANPTRESYARYLAAELRASRAGLMLAQRPAAIARDAKIVRG